MKSASRMVVLGAVAALSLCLLAAGPVNADNSLKLQVLCPSPVSVDVPFNATIKAYNFSDAAIQFNRVVVAYLSPDMTVKGPYIVSKTLREVPAATNPDQPGLLTFYVPVTISSPQQNGSLVPILVTLWQDQYTAGYSRGAGAGAAKVQTGASAPQ